MAIVDLTGFTQRYEDYAFHPAGFSRGYSSQLNGNSSFAVANGGAWAATFTVPAMCASTGRKFAALVAQADGRAGTVLVNPDPHIFGNQARKTRYTDSTQFTDVTTFTDNLSSFAGSVTVSAAANRDSQVDQMAITLPNDIAASDLIGMIIGTGDLFGGAGAYQAMKCTSIVAQSGQDVTIKIRPRLRKNITVGQPVYIGAPPLRMRFVDDYPAGAIRFSRRGVMLPATFDMVESD